jgi:hypothetical protein
MFALWTLVRLEGKHYERDEPRKSTGQTPSPGVAILSSCQETDYDSPNSRYAKFYEQDRGVHSESLGCLTVELSGAHADV